MLRSILIHTIKVVRPDTDSANDFGENVLDYENPSSEIIYAKLARVERWNHKFEYNDAGQRDARRILVYVDKSIDVELKDLIEYPVDTRLGVVIAKNEQLKGTSTGIYGYELELEAI